MMIINDASFRLFTMLHSNKSKYFATGQVASTSCASVTVCYSIVSVKNISVFPTSMDGCSIF